MRTCLQFPVVLLIALILEMHTHADQQHGDAMKISRRDLVAHKRAVCRPSAQSSVATGPGAICDSALRLRGGGAGKQRLGGKPLPGGGRIGRVLARGPRDPRAQVRLHGCMCMFFLPVGNVHSFHTFDRQTV